MRGLVLFTSAVAFLAKPATATACSPAFGYFAHSLDEAHQADALPPGAPSVAVSLEETEEVDHGCDNPCGSSGGRRLVLTVSAVDDRTPTDRMGYRIRATGKHVPRHLARELGDLIPGWFPNTIVFKLGSEGRLDFELEVRAVDLNGNAGPPIYTQINDSDTGGCRTTGHARPLGLLLVTLAIILATRRRR